MTFEQAIGFCKLHHLMIWFSGEEVYVMRYTFGRELEILGKDTLLAPAVDRAAEVIREA